MYGIGDHHAKQNKPEREITFSLITESTRGPFEGQDQWEGKRKGGGANMTKVPCPNENGMMKPIF
jgi:hypothetical protein